MPEPIPQRTPAAEPPSDETPPEPGDTTLEQLMNEDDFLDEILGTYNVAPASSAAAAAAPPAPESPADEDFEVVDLDALDDDPEDHPEMAEEDRTATEEAPGEPAPEEPETGGTDIDALFLETILDPDPVPAETETEAETPVVLEPVPAEEPVSTVESRRSEGARKAAETKRRRAAEAAEASEPETPSPAEGAPPETPLDSRFEELVETLEANKELLDAIEIHRIVSPSLQNTWPPKTSAARRQPPQFEELTPLRQALLDEEYILAPITGRDLTFYRKGREDMLSELIAKGVLS